MVSRCQIGIQSQGQLEFFNGALNLFCPEQRNTQAVVGLRRGGIDFHGSSQFPKSLRPLSLLTQLKATVDVGANRIVMEGNRKSFPGKAKETSQQAPQSRQHSN